MFKGSEGLLNRNLVLLLQGHFISKIGSALFDVALVLWLKEQIGLASIVGIVLMLSNLPEIILSPFSGTLVDMFSRKKVLVISDLIIGLIIIITSVVIMFFSDKTILTLWMLITGSVFIGICGSFFNPAVFSFIPELVKKEHLQKANSIYQFSSSSATFIGQSLAGILLTILGAPILFIINGISYLLSAISEIFITSSKTAIISHAENRNTVNLILFNLKEGLSYIWKKRELKRFLFLLCIYHFFISPFTVILPFYVTDFLKISQSWYGYILAFFGAGLLSGFIVAGVLRLSGKRQSILIVTCLIISSISYMLLGLICNSIATLILIYIIGLVIANIVVNLNTVIQANTPNSMHGRIFGIYNTLSTASIPLGMGFFGVMLDVLRNHMKNGSNGAAVIFFLCGLVLCLISVYFLICRNIILQDKIE